MLPMEDSANKLISEAGGATFGQATLVGVAYSALVDRLVAREKDVADFVEIPFEQLVHMPTAIEICARVPVVLHCASLSLAGNLPPDGAVVEQLAHWIEATKTPWLGEHLAYVRADGAWKQVAEHAAIASSSQAVQSKFDVGYTVSPQFSDAILERVSVAAAHWGKQFGLPVLIENGPVYFEMPGSTMPQFAFLRRLCAQTETDLLLDLTHFAITCGNFGLDPFSALNELPSERVVEVHLSGMTRQAGILWDDHSEAAPPLVFSLLELLLQRATPQAITIEYNWDSDFPAEILQRDIGRVRALVSAATSAGIA